MYNKDLVVMADGPTGSGKTRPALEKAYALAGKYPGTRCLLLRKAKAHASTTIQTTWSTQVVPAGDPAANLTSRNYRSPAYLFPNGSEVAVDGMYDGGGYNQAVMGTEWNFIVADEGTQYSEDDAQRLIGRLNRLPPEGGRVPFDQIIFPCNPDAPSHWLWRWHLAGKLTRIASRLEDNPIFHDGKVWTEQGRKYLATVDRYTGVMRERNRFGRWVGAEGMIYDEWDDSRHVLKDLPMGCMGWDMVRSIDFGYVDAFVCQWWAIEPGRKTMVLVRELVRHKTDLDHLAAEVNALSVGMRVRFTVADHADAMGRAMFSKYGIPTQGCDKPKANEGWVEHFEPVKQRLRFQPDGSARLYVWKGALSDRDPRLVTAGVPIGLLEELPSYAWLPPKEGRPPKEQPQGHNDHSCAALRYGVHAIERFYSPSADAPFVAAPLIREPSEEPEQGTTWVGRRFLRPRT